MTNTAAPLFERLIGAGDPRDFPDWRNQDGYYVAKCRVSADDVPGLIAIAEKWMDPDWTNECVSRVGREDAELLPVTAWRTLAELKNDAAVKPLVDILCALNDECGEWASEELPHVFGKIGESTIEPLFGVISEESFPDVIRSNAVRGLRQVVDYHPYTRDRIVPILVDWMARAGSGHRDFNTDLMVELTELHAVEAAEPIERAFAADLLDVGVIGDWEEVRRILGVEGLGLKMPDHPQNSIT
jgi:hypothetical protein